MNRSASRVLDYDEAKEDNDYPSHCDIVHRVEGSRYVTIGGNVGQAPGQVGTKRFRWKHGALINGTTPAQQVYAVLRAPAE
jgi:hypothetical protein